MCIPLFLVYISIDLQHSTPHVYVEVVLRGKTEGIFLEDPGASHGETVDKVSKLGSGFSYVWPNKELTSLIETSSLLDPWRHR